MSEPTYSPMIQQYRDVKSQYKNELLLFRLGDFYELFFEDAEIASRELGLTLTGRASGNKKRTPMCGVPYHSIDNYIAKLIKKGYRIAICNQIEDPKLAKGIVKRAVTRVVTPGTSLSEQILEEGNNQYLACIVENKDSLCLTVSDISTGETQWLLEKGKNKVNLIWEELYRLQPVELVIDNKSCCYEKFAKLISQKINNCLINNYQIDTTTFKYFMQHFSKYANLEIIVKETLETLLNYLHETMMMDLSHLKNLSKTQKENYLSLDSVAIRNLELTKNMTDGSKKKTLLDIMDYTNTSMGARTLKRWIELPLRNIVNIEQRQDSVELLLKNISMRDELIELFKSIYDLERIVSKLEVGSANARDLVSLRTSLQVLPRIKNILNSSNTFLLNQLNENINLNEDLFNVLSDAIVDEPPFLIREGGMIKTGYNKDLDELHLIAKNNTAWMQNFEMKLKESTGIKNLKVGYNKVFGYYIEVSKGNVASVPDYFVRKQTLVNAERYIVPELKNFENEILSAKEKIHQLEYYLFNNIREIIRKNISNLQETAKTIGIIDALLSLSILAYKNNYIRPTLNNKNEIKINDGRHPVVEQISKKEIFVPNDTYLNSSNQKTMIITGPNMSGKSTYMRQVALLVLMTQMGSFIPAKSANIYPVDKIFTRVGASDDLATGQSTFMVEMNEVANILKNATSNSLVILDEVGRGTSTYDGMSIAKAVIEYINNKIGAKTLFATHYHQLMELEDIMDGVKNFSVAVKERSNNIVFLRRIIRGGTDKSYGIHVAKLAGIPKNVLVLAEKYLNEYDNNEFNSLKSAQKEKLKVTTNTLVQEDLFTTSLTKKIIELDVLSLSPIEALNELYKLQEEAKKQGGIL